MTHDYKGFDVTNYPSFEVEAELNVFNAIKWQLLKNVQQALLLVHTTLVPEPQFCLGPANTVKNVTLSDNLLICPRLGISKM